MLSYFYKLLIVFILLIYPYYALAGKIAEIDSVIAQVGATDRVTGVYLDWRMNFFNMIKKI